MLEGSIAEITGNKKKFLLLRIAGMQVDTALNVCATPKTTYRSWLNDEQFKAIYDQLADLTLNYRKDAINLLRRDNQLSAVLLESKIIDKMAREIESGEYDLVKTNLAKEVYSKLVNDLDWQPTIANISYEQRIANIIQGRQSLPIPPAQIEGGVQRAEDFITPNSVQTEEHCESHILQTNQQTSQQTQSPNEEESERIVDESADTVPDTPI